LPPPLAHLMAPSSGSAWTSSSLRSAPAGQFHATASSLLLLFTATGTQGSHWMSRRMISPPPSPPGTTPPPLAIFPALPADQHNVLPASHVRDWSPSAPGLCSLQLQHPPELPLPDLRPEATPLTRVQSRSPSLTSMSTTVPFLPPGLRPSLESLRFRQRNGRNCPQPAPISLSRPPGHRFPNSPTNPGSTRWTPRMSSSPPLPLCRSLVTQKLLPALRQFQADVVFLLSTGLDSHYDDLYHFLTEDGIHWLTAEFLRHTALPHTQVISILEGGYSPPTLHLIPHQHSRWSPHNSPRRPREEEPNKSMGGGGMESGQGMEDW
jgi:hypothetical protein